LRKFSRLEDTEVRSREEVITADEVKKTQQEIDKTKVSFR